jgi:hypothetical protein
MRRETDSRKVAQESRREWYVKKLLAPPEVDELAQRRYGPESLKEVDPALRAT